MGSLADKIKEALVPDYGDLSPGHLLKLFHADNNLVGRDQIAAFYAEAAGQPGSIADRLRAAFADGKPGGGGPPVFIAEFIGFSQSSVTTIELDSSVINAGDLILVIHSIRQGATYESWHTHTGFTKLDHSFYTGSHTASCGFYKIADGTETTFSVSSIYTSVNKIAIALIFRGVNQETPFDTNTVWSEQQLSGNLNFYSPDITTLTDNSFLVAHALTNSATVVMSPSTNYTPIRTQWGYSGSSSLRISTAMKLAEEKGVQNGSIWPLSQNAYYNSITLALRPA